MYQFPPPRFMLQMDFYFFNVDIINVFTSTFVDLCYAISCPFRFPSRSKLLPLDILKLLVATLRNQDKKIAFIRVDEYVALVMYSKFINTYNNTNIIVQTTGGDAS